MKLMIWGLFALLLLAPDGVAAQGDLSVLDALEMDDLVEVEPPAPAWQDIGGPVALGVFFVLLLWLGRIAVPFRVSKESLTLFYYPTGVKRGLALAITLYGIAFAFGAAEISYQLHLHGSAEAYFANMSQGKLIAFTHAHLFGFTTSFLVIGIPFSMQFNHLWIYQWIFPIGLAAALTDVISWWGIKYVSPNFEVISIICGILFSVTYLYMLVGLLRVLLFPQVIWATDKDRDQRLSKKQQDPDSQTGY
ncbi:MAG: hypothetical protein ABF271_01420 [Abyssibacter sp.]|uniref:hypothetical protein n=1 Tax=Abyssibacter sp. TaxID=2320200 RepID=UPI00321BB227